MQLGGPGISGPPNCVNLLCLVATRGASADYLTVKALLATLVDENAALVTVTTRR
jgi:hypothetical protein